MAGRRATEQALRERIRTVGTRGYAPARLASALMDAVLTVIPSDGYRMFGLDPATRLINRLLAASDDDHAARLEWLRDYYLLPSPFTVIEQHRLMERRLTAVAVQPRQDTCWGYPDDLLMALSDREHARWFHELACPIGGTLLAHVAAHGRWIAAIQMYRRDDDRLFSVDEVRLMERLSPLIGEALAPALARERALGASQGDRDASGVIVLGPDRRVTMTTGIGETWLARLGDMDLSGPAALPAAVWSAVAGTRNANSPAITLSAPTSRGPVRIEASRAGADGSIAVVLTPERPPTAPDIPEDWPLTARERRVVGLLVRGYTNREIAAALHVSENTVEYHLRNAYGSLDVRSRTHLLARFFRETFWPALETSYPDDVDG